MKTQRTLWIIYFAIVLALTESQIYAPLSISTVRRTCAVDVSRPLTLVRGKFTGEKSGNLRPVAAGERATPRQLLLARLKQAGAYRIDSGAVDDLLDRVCPKIPKLYLAPVRIGDIQTTFTADKYSFLTEAQIALVVDFYLHGGAVGSVTNSSPAEIRALAVNKAVEIIAQGIPPLDQRMKALMALLPTRTAAETENVATVPQGLWSNYVDIFRRICGEACTQGIPEFDQLRRILVAPEPAQGAITTALLEIFLESHLFISFTEAGILYKGWAVPNVPYLAVREAEEPRLETLDIMGTPVQLMCVFTGRALVPPVIQEKQVAAAMYRNVTLRGLPVASFSRKDIREILNAYYKIRLHVFNHNSFPDEERTGDPDVDEALAGILKRQWPDREFESYAEGVDEQGRDGMTRFTDAYYEQHEREAIRHEAVHEAMKGFNVLGDGGEFFTYLDELGNSRYPWLRLYFIAKWAFRAQDQNVMGHEEACRFMADQVLPDLARCARSDLGAAGSPGYRKKMLAALVGMDESVFKSECPLYFRALRSVAQARKTAYPDTTVVVADAAYLYRLWLDVSEAKRLQQADALLGTEV